MLLSAACTIFQRANAIKSEVQQLRQQISQLKKELSQITKCYPTSKLDLQVDLRKPRSAMLRRGHSLTLELMGVRGKSCTY